MLTGSSSSSSFADEMCVESRRAAAAGRRGGGKRQQQAAGHGKAAAKQPQRGLGVAQLEKIRLHNQMMAAYRSAAGGASGQQDYYAAARVPFGGGAPASADVASPPGASSSFLQPYRLTSGCYSEDATTTEWGIVDAHRCYDGGSLLPYSSSPPPPSLFAHGLRDSSGQRLGQLDTHQRPATPQQHCWIRSASDDDGSSAEDLDLELRL